MVEEIKERPFRERLPLMHRGQNLARHVIHSRGGRYANRIMRGEPDEKAHDWRHEAQAKKTVRDHNRGYVTRFFDEEGIWRSRRGFFRLFERKDGVRGIVFHPHSYGLEVEERVDESFTNTNGAQKVLKSTKGVHLVRAWPKGFDPTYSDISHTIDGYTYQLENAILDEAVLFETDQRKGIWRSGSCAYVMHFVGGDEDKPLLERAVSEVYFYVKALDNGKLVNPKGENALERVLWGFDAGIPLFQTLEKQGLHKPFDSELPVDEDFPFARTRAEAELIIRNHYSLASLRYLKRQDPLDKEEKALHKNYYTARRLALVALAIAKQGKYYLQRFTAENFSGWRSLGAGIVSTLRSAIFSSNLFLAGISLIGTGVAALGVIKIKIDQDTRLDLRDPLVKELSNPARRIKAFATLQRALVRKAFDNADVVDDNLGTITMLSTPTFDRVRPSDIKSEPNLMAHPFERLGPFLQERGRSDIRFYADKNMLPSPNPSIYDRAYKVRRTDGITAVTFINENIEWGVYSGKPLDPVTPPPEGAEKDVFKDGYVIQVDYRPNAPKPVTYIKLSDAEAFFEEQFNMPLLEKGIARPASATTEWDGAAHSDITILKEAFAAASVELAARIEREPTDREKQHKTTIDRIARQHAMEFDFHNTFRPFVGNLVEALALMDKRGLDYRFHEVGKADTHSLQLHCPVPHSPNLTIVTSYGTDLSVMENGKRRIMETPEELLAYVHDRLQHIPPIVTLKEKIASKISLRELWPPRKAAPEPYRRPRKKWEVTRTRGNKPTSL